MKFTLSWLKQHLKSDATLEEITTALTDLGLEVESVDDPKEMLSAFTIGYVKEAKQHPNADRLRVCKVETGEGERQIICGAPNARAGIYVVVAHPGMYIPGIDTTISVGKIRGVESQGMMCSEREMQLSDEHDGIIELSEGTVGGSFVDYLRAHDGEKIDPAIEIAITPNRPDALGVRGIARDLAARQLGSLIPHNTAPVAGKFSSPINVHIDEKARKGCPVFIGRFIRGVKNGPSPDWLQTRLKSIGLRPISALVDITNFLTYDRNRPLHVFDADKIKGNLHVHLAKGGESLQALDEKQYSLRKGMILISDDNRVQSIAGIMGGLATGCNDTTKNVFLEVAYFDPVITALSGRALKIESDARYRFERGIDPLWVEEGMEYATKMIIDICGGEASAFVQAGEMPDYRRSYVFNPEKVQSLVGMDIAKDVQEKILTDLGFVLDTNRAFVPSWRPDIQGEADLVEEIVRIASLEKLVAKPMKRMRGTTGVSKPVLTPSQRREQIARRALAEIGYNECVTYSFVDSKSAALFCDQGQEIALENPISSEMTHLRPSLLPGLIQAWANNRARGFTSFSLFEIGAVFADQTEEDQSIVISGLLSGTYRGRSVHETARAVDIFDAKADMEYVLHALNCGNKGQITRIDAPWWHPGRHGALCLGHKKSIAEFGEIHPRILREMGFKGMVCAFTIKLAELPIARTKKTSRGALSLTNFQSVERDFAFIVDENLEACILVNAVKGVDKRLISSVHVFDEFKGAKAETQFGAGKKSLALSVRLDPKEKTLNQKDIEMISDKIIAKAIKVTGGVLRAE